MFTLVMTGLVFFPSGGQGQCSPQRAHQILDPPLPLFSQSPTTGLRVLAFLVSLFSAASNTTGSGSTGADVNTKPNDLQEIRLQACAIG